MSQKLHKLIHSLDKEEKRAFRLSTDASKNYVKLFETLDNMDEYADLKLSRAFPSLSAPALSNTKETLSSNLLACLQKFHHRDSINVAILNQLAQIDILKQKGQMEILEDLIAKTKKTIIAEERYPLLTYLLQVEIDWIRIRKLKDTSPEDFVKKLAEWQEAISKSGNVADYRRLLFPAEQMRLFSGSTEQVESYKLYMEQLMLNPLFTDRSKALSLLALDQYYSFWFWYHDMSRDIESQIKVTREWVMEYEKIPGRMPQAGSRYLEVIYKHGVVATAIDDFEALDSTLAKLQNLEIESDIISFTRWNFHLGLCFEKYYRLEKIADIAELLPLYERLESQYSHHLTDGRRVDILKEFTIAFLLKKNYARSIDFGNQVLNNYPGIRFRGQKVIRLAGMLSHLALGDHSLLDSLYRSYEYFIQQHAKLSPADKQLKKYIADIQKTKNSRGKKAVHKSYYPFFKDYENDSDYFILERFLKGYL